MYLCVVVLPVSSTPSCLLLLFSLPLIVSPCLPVVPRIPDPMEHALRIALAIFLSST